MTNAPPDVQPPAPGPTTAVAPDNRHLPASPATAHADGESAAPRLSTCSHCTSSADSAVRAGSDGPEPHPDPGPGDLARRTHLATAGQHQRHWPPPWFWLASSLRLPWIVATIAVCAAGVTLARVWEVTAARPLLLVTAPLLPVLCVAGSYGGTGDPFMEVTRTTPAGGLRVLLVRTGQILALSMPVLTVTAALLPGGKQPAYTSAGWLLPCLTLTLAALFLSSYVGNWTAALLVSGGWTLALSLLTQPLMKSNKWPQEERLGRALTEVSEKFVGIAETLVWGAAATILAELLVLRRHSFDRPGAR